MRTSIASSALRAFRRTPPKLGYYCEIPNEKYLKIFPEPMLDISFATLTPMGQANL